MDSSTFLALNSFFYFLLTFLPERNANYFIIKCRGARQRPEKPMKTF
jgi:hypothetical protein